ncbi:MAG: hemerythrin domain-containing protein [Actinomycetota bacterium]|nr:hemerythrin domain-containing protein [Actinomycetota bacterium]
MDITELILNDHRDQRRMFAFLDDIDRDNPDALGAIWSRLKILLDVHAEAEEKVFYPHLLKIGSGAGGQRSATAEVKDVIKDHNQIRDATREVGRHDVGSDAWWKAVITAREANSDHMAEEEREDLADFRHHADLQLRHSVAVAFLTYESQHAAGIAARDRDPDRYVERHS